MTMKSWILVLIFGLAAIQSIFAQNRKEYYFSFPVHTRSEIDAVSGLISIDNVRNDTVWAYANQEQFLKFCAGGYDINLLPAPGYNPDVEMREYGMLSPSATWNYYPTYAAYESLMTQFQSNYPGLCHVSVLTTLSSGRKIMMAKISDNVASDEPEPEVLYTSSIHGDETTGYILMLHLIDYLLANYGSNAEVTDLVNNLEIYINPLANPDGTYAGGNSTVGGATRYNFNGVDLNRNYPDPEDGDHPDGNAWQPETVAFMDFATQHHFVTAVNFHGGAEVVNYPWDTWSTLHADNNWWIYVSREYADTVHVHAPSGYMSDYENGITNGYAWYTISGGRQDYMNYFQRCREVTIELSDTKLLPASQLETHWNYNWRSLILYLKEARYGIHGTITDQVTGLPVVAKIYITGHDLNNSEVYSSAIHGDYHRPLKAGTYTLQISAGCYLTQTITGVVVGDHNTVTLDVQMVPSAGVMTSAITSITMNSATGGGNVICEGGSQVTARGVCWSSSASPTVAGQHTNDGSGPGTFISVITGLSANTTCHVRAYATNAAGTTYGEDVTFATTCGSIADFPWTEGFENGGSMPGCWSQEQVNGSGVNWAFIAGNGGSYPSAAHGGSYNACLKDATSSSNLNRLISPPINLSLISNPTLTFWHYMRSWAGDQDELTVYYRTSSGSAWQQLATYTTSVSSWTLRTISLPNISDSYCIAFEGNARYGYGVCIDDVAVTGTLIPVLTVDPLSRNVDASAGTALYTVTSNGNWTAVSDQSWCTVTPSGSGNGVITASFTQNEDTMTRTANITISMTGHVPEIVSLIQAGETNKTLSLSVLLEGLYAGSGQMYNAMDEGGPRWGDSIADILTLELHLGSDFDSLVFSETNVELATDGSALVDIPVGLNDNYYIAIRHRNSILTVSSMPVSFGSAYISYAFNQPDQVFGSNLLQSADGYWLVYAGDTNQDGIIDSDDMIQVGNSAAVFTTGYITADLNGDALVDSGDMIMLEKNAAHFIEAIIP